MQKLRSFDPISSVNARVLILGSMPGQRSLDAGQYYAHPRNDFWKIMEAVTGLKASADYHERIRSLQVRGIALWDVLHSCHRKGSLDAAIEASSVEVNDFRSFFLASSQHRHRPVQWRHGGELLQTLCSARARAYRHESASDALDKSGSRCHLVRAEGFGVACGHSS